MTWKSYIVMSGAGLLATWLVSTPTVQPERPAAAPTAARTAVQASADIEAQADRLRVRVRPETPYEEPVRNPFRFAARASPQRGAGDDPEPLPPAEPFVPPTEPEPPPPLVRLTGVATETVDGARRRTAILVTAQGILSVHEGDAVGAEYRVGRIEDNAIELLAHDGTTRRLTLRP